MAPAAWGEVYRARDTKLGRDVALKVLPDSFAAHDGRFLINVATEEATASPITVILNWTVGLNK